MVEPVYERQQARLPELLNLPFKALPMVWQFNEYKYLLLEGGRGSGKTQSAARFLLFLAEQSRLRIVCGRELETSIEESVYTVLVDLIEQYELPYEVQSRKLIHKNTKSTFTFKGFRAQNAVNIKGLEGVDIVWIDEAEAVSKEVLDRLVPTLRKDKVKLMFTMNRYMRDDVVPMHVHGREDALCIEINYLDNPFCTQAIKVEAADLRAKSEKEYKHIYLNHPLDTADDFLFNYDKLAASYHVKPHGEPWYKQRVLAIDFAAQGNDLCVATVFDRLTHQHWKPSEQIAWDEPDTTISIGKIVNLVGHYQPDVAILDVGGMGHVVHDRLTELGVNIQRFDGASTAGVDKKNYVNARAEGYYTLKEWFEQGHIVMPPEMKVCVDELEKIKMKFRSDGRRVLQAKTDLKKELKVSPDHADSLMMAVWAAVKYLGNTNSVAPQHDTPAITRRSGSQRQVSAPNRSLRRSPRRRGRR